MPNNPVRPKSSRPGQRSDIFGKSMRWGKQENTRKHSFTESISSADSSLKDEEISFQRARYPILPGNSLKYDPGHSISFKFEPRQAKMRLRRPRSNLWMLSAARIISG